MNTNLKVCSRPFLSRKDWFVSSDGIHAHGLRIFRTKKAASAYLSKLQGVAPAARKRIPENPGALALKLESEGWTILNMACRETYRGKLSRQFVCCCRENRVVTIRFEDEIPVG